MKKPKASKILGVFKIGHIKTNPYKIGLKQSVNMTNSFESLEQAQSLIDEWDKVEEYKNLLIEAEIQINYMQEKFGETGTGNQVLSKIKQILNS